MNRQILKLAYRQGTQGLASILEELAAGGADEHMIMTAAAYLKEAQALVISAVEKQGNGNTR